MSEPTYEYIKGQGWVPTSTTLSTSPTSLYCIMFKTGQQGWRNTINRGAARTYEACERELQDLHYTYVIHNGWTDWQFKIVPIEEENDYT